MDRPIPSKGEAVSVAKMRTVHSPKVPTPKPGIKSNCKVVGNQVFIGGMVGRREDGTIPDGMAAQSQIALRKIKDLMEAAGGVMADVVNLNVFVTELAAEEWQAARREFFTGDFPCATFVVVKALADPRMLIEINAIGFIGASQ
ncbi:MAG: RidA family protein [Lautropia sp.]